MAFYSVYQQGRSWHVKDENQVKVLARCPTKDMADRVVRALFLLEETEDVIAVAGAVRMKSLVDLATRQRKRPPE